MSAIALEQLAEILRETDSRRVKTTNRKASLTTLPKQEDSEKKTLEEVSNAQMNLKKNPKPEEHSDKDANAGVRSTPWILESMQRNILRPFLKTMVGIYVLLILSIDIPEILQDLIPSPLEEEEDQDISKPKTYKKLIMCLSLVLILGALTILISTSPEPDLSVITERLKEIEAYDRNAILVASGVDDPRLR
jgi:hypothetical protein